MPEPSVTATRLPGRAPVAVTVTPGSTPPSGPATRPSMAPVVVCATAAVATAAASRAASDEGRIDPLVVHIRHLLELGVGAGHPCRARAEEGAAMDVSLGRRVRLRQRPNCST